MTPSLVSTIIPTYNRSHMLREAVESVLQQTYRPIEIVIVDDGSSDDTYNVATELQAASPDNIHVYHQQNSGAASARNTGLSQSIGEYIQYLDSDDLLLPEKFALQVAALLKHPKAGLCYGTTIRKSLTTGEEQIWARTDQVIDNIFPSFLMKRGWDTNCPLWRRSTCETVGPWGNYRVNEDWEHDLRAGILGFKPVKVPERVAIVRDHDNDRTSGMNTGFTPEIVTAMFETHASIWEKMKAANLTDWSYLEQYSRKMFWIARLCGEHKLNQQASLALQTTMEMVQANRSCWDLKVYRTAASILGWQRTARISEWARRCLKSRRTSST